MKKLILGFLLAGLISCQSANYYTALDPVGIVLETTPASVLVCFPVSGNAKGLSQGCTTYTLKGGHNYKPGDVYPDPAKYQNHFKNNSNNQTTTQ